MDAGGRAREPLYWTGTRARRRALAASMHVSWYEADAYARLRGKRLPDRGRVGEGGVVGSRDRRVVPLPVGRRDALAGAARTSTRPAAGPPRRAPTPTAPRPRGALGMVGDRWEWTATRVRRLPGLPRPPLPRVLGGLLRRRLQGAARRLVGHAPARRRQPLPQLGPARSGARSSPGSDARRDRRATSTGGALDSLAADVRARDWACRSRSSRRSTSTTSAARSCSTRSPRCPSTTPRAASAQILNRHAPEIAELTGAEELVELGSGTASKTRALLYAMAGRGQLRALRPVRLLGERRARVHRAAGRALPRPRAARRGRRLRVATSSRSRRAASG